MAFALDGCLFVTELGGKVRIIKDGVLLDTPFLSVSPTLVVKGGCLELHSILILPPTALYMYAILPVLNPSITESAVLPLIRVTQILHFWKVSILYLT